MRSLDPDAARPEHVMESKKLTLGFSGRTVLADVNVALKRGSITALIGPTGSGKSTFLRTLNRMNDRVPGFTRDGDVTFDELSLWAQQRRSADAASPRRHAVPTAQPVPHVDQGQRGGGREGAPHRQGQATRRGVPSAA